MINADAIAEILATYKKYGWHLRRVLLTEGSSKKIGKDKTELFGDAVITDSVIDAAWFSRPPVSGGVAWEIRYLGDIPFALLEKLDEDDPDFETAVRDVEIRLHETISAKTAA